MDGDQKKIFRWMVEESSMEIVSNFLRPYTIDNLNNETTRKLLSPFLWPIKGGNKALIIKIRTSYG